MNFKELRRAMIVFSNTIDKLRESRELSLAKTTIEKVGMWTGTYMGRAEIWEKSYDYDNEKEKIEDIREMHDETDKTLDKEILDRGVIYTVYRMREYFRLQLNALIDFSLNEHTESQEEFDEAQLIHTNMSLFNIYTSITEAKMWLGMELRRIKKEGEDAPEIKL
jgi:hypothetical protein